MAFERAINVDRPEKTLAEMYQSLESISIEDDYSGPKLSNEDTVTLDFMKELMQWYKDQKKLHKKYAYKVNLITIFRSLTLTTYTFTPTPFHLPNITIVISTLPENQLFIKSLLLTVILNFGTLQMF